MGLPDPTPENVANVKGLLKSPDLDASKRASMEKWLSDSLSHGGNEASPKAAAAQQLMSSLNDDYSPVLAVQSASGKRSLFAEPEHAPANPSGEVQYWNEPSQAEARKAGVPYEEYADKKWQEARAAAEASNTPIIRDKYVVPTTPIGKAKKLAREVSREAPSILDAAVVGADNTVTAGLAHRGLADVAAKTGLDPGLPEQLDAAAEEHPGVASAAGVLSFLGGGGISGAIAKKAARLFGVGATAGKAASSMLPQILKGAGAGAATSVAQGTAEDAVKAADQAIRGQEVNAMDDPASRDAIRAILGGGVGAIAGAAGARAAQHRDTEYSPEAPDIRRVEKAGGELKFFAPNGVKAPPAAQELYNLANEGGEGIPVGSHAEEVAAKKAEPFVSSGAADYLAKTKAQGQKLVEQYLGSSASTHEVEPKKFMEALQGIFKTRTFDADQAGTPYTNSGEFKTAINQLGRVSRPMSDAAAEAARKSNPGAIKMTVDEARKHGFNVAPPEMNDVNVPVQAAPPVAIPPPPKVPNIAGPKPGQSMASWLQERMTGPGGEAPTAPPPPPAPPESIRTAAATDRSPPMFGTSMPAPVNPAIANSPTTPSPGATGPEGQYVIITPRRLTPEKFEEVVHGIDKAAKAASKTASPDKAHALIQKAIREDRDQFPWPAEMGPEPTAKITERDADGVAHEVTVRGWSALHTLHHQALDEAEKTLAATGLTPETAGTAAGSRAVKNSLMGRGTKGSLEAEVAQDALASTPEGRQALANLDILNATQRLRGKATPIGGKLKEIRSLDFRMDPLYRFIASKAGPAGMAGVAGVTQEPPKDDRAAIKALLQSYGIGAQ